MQIRKVEGLESLLRSLSLDQEPGKIHHVVYPWHEYSKAPRPDIGFWYSAERCHYSTLRRLILEKFNEIGHPCSERLADGAVLAFVRKPKTADVLTELETMLNSFASADVSQFLFVPTSALIEKVRLGQQAEYDLIGFFGHGPFQYEPVSEDLIKRITYRLQRIG